MVLWQEPYSVLEAVDRATYRVRLISRTEGPGKLVHWSRMKRFAGNGFDPDERLVRTAQNDCQVFQVDGIDGWRVSDEGDIELWVRWRGFQLQDRTCESIDELKLKMDVPSIVRKFLQDKQGEGQELADYLVSLRTCVHWEQADGRQGNIL